MNSSSNDKLKIVPASEIAELMVRDPSIELPWGYWFDKEGDLGGYSLEERHEHVLREVSKETGLEKSRLMICNLPGGILVCVLDKGVGENFPAVTK